MFTGIIEEIGKLRHVTKQGQAMILAIEASRVLEDVHLGDSISINGVCLTVISFDPSGFQVDVTPETYRRSNLRKLHSGSKVNLERAIAVNGRFGGHFVQGHVDTTGTIRSRQDEENAVIYNIELADPALFKYIIAQGSITIDGISLTVVSVSDSSFAVSIIPHTLAETILQDKQAGDTVNIECDLLGKYVDHLLNYRNKPSQHGAEKPSTITASFLAEHGFI